MSTKFVKTRGNRFTIGDKEIIFNGIGIGSWFNMEHFMGWNGAAGFSMNSHRIS